MRGARREDLRRDQLLSRPDARQRIESVGERLAEHDDVRFDVEVLDRPELSGAIKSHLDFIIDQQNLARFQHCRKLLEIARWRNHVAAGALDRLDKEGGKLRLLRLAVPDRVILAVK